MYSPRKVPFQKPIKEFSAGYTHCGLVTTNSETFTWGSNNHGETGHSEKGIGRVDFKCHKISCGHDYTILLTDGGEMLISGKLPFKVQDKDYLTSFEQLAKFDTQVQVH